MLGNFIKFKLSILLLFLCFRLTAQFTYIDTAIIRKVKDEAFHKNDESFTSTQVAISFISLCDNYGPRLTWSPEYKNAAEFVSLKLKEWNLQNVHFESFENIGKSWSINNYFASIKEPSFMSLIAYPNAWSQGTKGITEGNVIFLDVKTLIDFEKFRGKLKDKIVLLTDEAYFILKASAEPGIPFKYYSDSTLEKLEKEKYPDSTELKKYAQAEERYLKDLKFISKKVEFCQNEDVALLIIPSYSNYGIVKVFGIITSVEPKNLNDFWSALGSNPEISQTIPQMTISLEQYNYILRLIKKGKTVKMQANIDVSFYKPEKGFNVIAEIPGTDLKNEIVMIGAHLDSFHGSFGAIDNAVGVATCMDVMRILSKLGIKPRRTIRIGLWGGEEEGLLGSKDYVKQHFQNNNNEKCYIYFNLDGGAGKINGIFSQGNDQAKTIFKEWFNSFPGTKRKMIVANYTSVKSDEISFIDAGLPGFTFIQNILDYPKISHSNMDMVDRVPIRNLPDNVNTLAILAYLAAMREGDFPAIHK